MYVFSTTARWDAIDRIWDEIFARPLLPEPTAAPAKWASGDLLTPSVGAEPVESEAAVTAVIAEVPAARRRVSKPRPARQATRTAASKETAAPAPSKTRRPRKASPEPKAPASRSRRKPDRAV